MTVADLTERDFHAQMKDLAKACGWRRYHTYRSSRSPSGFPDEVLARERVVFAELKRDKGKPTGAQREWLTALAKAGAEVYLWRPGDLDEVAQVLGHRWWWTGGQMLLRNEVSAFTPCSLWLPDGGRVDELRDA